MKIIRYFKNLNTDDRQSILGLAIIGVLGVFWILYPTPTPFNVRLKSQLEDGSIISMSGMVTNNNQIKTAFINVYNNKSINFEITNVNFHYKSSYIECGKREGLRGVRYMGCVISGQERDGLNYLEATEITAGELKRL